MALSYSTQTYTQSNNQLPLFGAQQISPADSATDSLNNASPTSPRSHNSLQYHIPGQVRQLRPMKSPLYVPAALRPTERPNKNPPMTPPKSMHGSLDSLEDGKAGGTTTAHSRTVPLDLVVANTWIADENLGEVTGEPTREHWKVSTTLSLHVIVPHASTSAAHVILRHRTPAVILHSESGRVTCDPDRSLPSSCKTNASQQADQQSPSCDSPKCRSSFNLFRRRHHCRHCGHIFCSDHSGFTIPLNQEARFHPDGTPSRACDICHRHYQKWDTARSIRRKNSDDDNNKDSTRLDGSKNDPSLLLAGAKPGLISQGLSGGNSDQTVGSVPKDWAWSTF